MFARSASQNSTHSQRRHPSRFETSKKLLARLVLVSGLIAFAGIEQAFAVPSFAEQTGLPCAACHVGGLGPQLLPLGREFKLNGYTDRAVDDSIPVAAMVIAAYLLTAKDQAEKLAPHYPLNNIAALDEFAIFVAGGFGSHFGTFTEITYEGLDEKWTWDNLDLRAIAHTEFAGADLILGATLNNSPTVQDAWNTLPTWGFPFTDSEFVPSPDAAPLIADALAQNVLGLTAYGWWNDELYAEFGVYWSASRSLLENLGVDPGETGLLDHGAPYFRFAYQRDWGTQNASIGVFGLFAELFPERDNSAGATDSYDDLGVDASYQWIGDDEDVLSVNARFIHERRALAASFVLGDALNRNTDLDEIRANISYYWDQTYGATIGVFRVWGDGDPLLYGDNRTGKPDSSGFTLQADWTPFGKLDSAYAPWLNFRIGAQYTIYTEFNGTSTNYDGTGRDAADNNTLRIFTWLAI